MFCSLSEWKEALKPQKSSPKKPTSLTNWQLSVMTMEIYWSKFPWKLDNSSENRAGSIAKGLKGHSLNRTHNVLLVWFTCSQRCVLLLWFDDAIVWGDVFHSTLWILQCVGGFYWDFLFVWKIIFPINEGEFHFYFRT